MNPLEPNDPLWQLLGKTREVKVRGNFVQNVVREARNTPQDRGFFVAFKAWLKGESSGLVAWLRPGLALGALALLGWMSVSQDATGPTEVAVQVETSVPVMSAEEKAMIELADAMPTMPLETVNEMDVLLAMDDAAVLTDTELAFLLY
jgi:hypothetical protein